MRTANLSGKERCRFCADSGWVEVGTGDPHDEEWLRRVRGMSTEKRLALGLNRTVYGEVVAPCPKCEQGGVNEFPRDGRDGTPGDKLTPWGKDGYWQGRDHSWLQPLPDSRPMHAAEAKQAAAEAMSALQRSQSERSF